MLIYGTLIGIISIFSLLLLKSKAIANKTILEKYLVIGIVILASVIRIYKYDSAMGLNIDEAQAGYNAWSLANYGVDDHLLQNPVYLIAWGSGMNILYSLTCIPWIKLFGLSVASYRFSMVLLSILSLILLIYAICKLNNNFKKNLLFILILYFSPWMITANRWGLESNLFPILMCFFVGVFLLYKNSKNKKNKFLLFLLWNFILGISAYSYAANWIFLAVFVLFLYGYLFKTQIIKVKELLIGFLELFILVLPLLLYVLVNFIPLKTIHFLGLTIPRMEFNRSDSQMIFSQDGSIIHNIFQNICDTFNVLANGDSLIWNNLPFYGVMYYGFVLIMIVGLIIKVIDKNRTFLDNLMLIMFISNIPNILFMLPNTNHMNAMILPVFYFTMQGIVNLLTTKQLKIIGLIIYIGLFVGFINAYFNTYKDDLATNGINLQSTELSEAINIAKKNKYINIVNPNTTAMYAITRFLDPISPYKWDQEKENPVPSLVGTDYMKYGKYEFFNEVNQNVLKDKKAAIIVFEGTDVSQINKNNYNKTKYGKYDLYLPKKDKDND